jgi:HEAT repeat protein
MKETEMQQRRFTVAAGVLSGLVVIIVVAGAWATIREEFYAFQLGSERTARRIGAIEWLGEMGGPRRIESLLALYPSVHQSNVLEEEATEEVSAMKTALSRLCTRWWPACSPYLLNGLASEDFRIRALTCEVLMRARRGTPEIVEKLTVLVLKDEDSLASQAWATYALAVIDGEAALPILLDVLRSDTRGRGHGGRQHAAATGIGLIGPEATEAIPDLMAALERLEYPHSVASALASIGAAAVPVLIEALFHPKPVVRRFAAVSLRDMAVLQRMEGEGPRVFSALVELQQRETESLVKVAVFQALDEMRGKAHGGRD